MMRLLTFIETRTFSRLVREYLSDDEYNALQAAPSQNPQTGSVIREEIDDGQG